MAWSSGFFNSLNGDRKYGTDDISGIFTGVIHDGVFQTVGERFEVKASGGMGITVGTGRSWTFDCWSYNTSKLPIVLEKGDVLHPRWDVIVHEVNKTDAGRFAKPVYKQGTPSANPQVPELTNTELIEQRYLAKIYVAQNATSITQAQIENRVGTSDFPFVTGIVSSMNIDSLISQWKSQWSAWYNATDAGFDKWYNTQTDEFEDYFVDKKKAFDDWFEEMTTILNADAAGNLMKKIDAVQASANTKAPGGYGLGTFCKTISNWDDARVTGWYMGDNVANAPSNDWYVGCVIAHNDIYVYQILYPFTHNTAWEDSYIRVCQNGTWTGWVNPSSQLAQYTRDLVAGKMDKSNSFGTSDGKVMIFSNSEGGNIAIKSPNGSYTEIDSFNNTDVRIYSTDTKGSQVGEVKWPRVGYYDIKTINDKAISAYNLANGKASTSHASTGTGYGKGSGSYYGHLRLSDQYGSTADVNGGYAATPKAVKAAYDRANSAYSRANSAYSRADSAFQSASDGKTLIANAITGKGVSTSATATFAAMATNISAISTSATLLVKSSTMSNTSSWVTPKAYGTVFIFCGYGQYYTNILMNNVALGEMQMEPDIYCGVYFALSNVPAGTTFSFGTLVSDATTHFYIVY